MARGIILCGGMGTRLRPATEIINKHLIPIGAVPMVLYPIETLKSIGVTDILIITGGNHVGAFAEFLGDGSRFGVSFTYRVQAVAGGIAQALGLAKDFAAGESVAVILGDNVYDNDGIETPNFDAEFATIYLKEVDDAHRFGVFMDGKIIEKPEGVATGDAVTGLYIYPNDVFDVIPTLTTSARGELEITDVNNAFLNRAALDRKRVTSFWSDCGTPESLARTTRYFLDKKS